MLHVPDEQTCEGHESESGEATRRHGRRSARRRRDSTAVRKLTRLPKSSSNQYHPPVTPPSTPKPKDSPT